MPKNQTLQMIAAAVLKVYSMAKPSLEQDVISQTAAVI
jgi:hypothetical protein